jgi:large subunit ribosomal protein L35
MPKMKTKSGAKKRFSITKNGKVKRAKAFARHILEHKSPKQKRRLRGTTIASEVEVAKVKRMLPYA